VDTYTAEILSFSLEFTQQLYNKAQLQSASAVSLLDLQKLESHWMIFSNVMINNNFCSSILNNQLCHML